MILCIQNEKVAVQSAMDASWLVIEDKLRGQRWELDNDTVFWGGELSEENRPARHWKKSISALIPQRAEITSSGALRLFYLAGSTELSMVYTLLSDGVEVTLPAAASPVLSCTLPGAFRPALGSQKLILPIMQGVLWAGEGNPVDRLMTTGTHDHFAMGMYGILSDAGGLLYAAESTADAFWRYAREPDGKFFAQGIQISSLGEMAYDRKARIYLTDSSITAVAKKYRRRVMERGRFKSWEEKLSERPDLERIFGSIMCFIGYCQDDLDYPAEFKRLKKAGFDRALIYPVRMHSYSLDFQMGGKPPIWLSYKDMEAIKALGYDIAPWTWINEAVSDGTAQRDALYRIGKDGKPLFGWRIDDFVWNRCCSTRMAEHEEIADTLGMDGMTWDHFDVLTCAMIGECYAKDHPGHMGRPLSRSEDIDWLKKTLLLGQKGGRAVSSESFNDIFSTEYDMGSVKALPINYRRPFTVIPLTGLVYHDSILHTWWEPHNYNTHYFNRTGAAGYLEYGGGMTRLMAANDALMGSIPDVFPFGLQYGWTGRGSETYLYRIRFDDPEVQFALKAAKPVADLHRKIGKLEMTDLQILSQDGCVQRTTFADGTRVTANFSNFQRRECEDMQPLGAQCWYEDHL